MGIPRYGKICGSLITIDRLKHLRNQGKLFYVERGVTLQQNAVLRIAAVSPTSDKLIKGLSFLESSGETEFFIDEDCEIDLTNFSGYSGLNSDRNQIDKKSETRIYYDVPEPTNYVVRVAHTKYGSYKHNKWMSGGSYSREHGLILKKGSTYVWTIKSFSPDNHVHLISYWIETEKLGRLFYTEHNKKD